MTWLNLRFSVLRSFVTMATNLPSCFSIQFLKQLLKFLVNFTLLKYVKSQRSYGFLNTKELIFSFQILDSRRAERASNLTFSKCLHLVDLNNTRILITHDKMTVTANIRA